MSEQINKIIKSCIKGDRQSQMKLFKRFNSLLFAVSMKYMSDRTDAEEVLQESWIQIFQGLAKYKDQGKFEGWIKTIVIRTAWKAKKKQMKDQSLDNISSTYVGSLSNGAIDRMTCEEVLTLLKYIPDASRQVFKMFVLDGYNHQEIGEILEITDSTSRAHLSKARKVMRQKFDDLNKIATNGLKAI